MAAETFERWAIVELMGHVRVAGRVTEEERFGAKVGRVDIPQKDGSFCTQYFGGGSLYRLSVVSEEVARSVAASNPYVPASAWELPKLALPAPKADEPTPASDPDDDWDQDEDDDDEPSF